MRTVDELEASAMAVLNKAYYAGAYVMRPLFSGGHDSLCATFLASQHPAFRGEVFHIKTGIGARYTLEFVERVCLKYGWTLRVYQSTGKDTYEQYVRERGFPGPAMHNWIYQRIKERGVRQITKGKAHKMLVTGCRSQESVRRMGHVEPVKFGETMLDKKTGQMKRVNRKRVWTAPCHDWSKAEQQHFMDELGLPINKLKVALGMSGECFCGAFASPGELDRIRQYAPDVAEEIDRLAAIAKECGKPCVWGQRPKGELAQVETGPLCTSCDYKAAASGLMITQN